MATPFIFGALDAHAGPTEVDAATLTRLLTAETANLTTVQVVGAAEMRDALNLEAEKEAAGCLDNSCIAEIAAAMGTSHVLQTQLGAIGNTLLLSIQIFDDNARVLSREAIRGNSLDDIGRQLRPALGRILAKSDLRKPPASKNGAANNYSLLILDVQFSSVRAGPPPAADSGGGPSLLFWGGATMLGLGAVCGIAAGFLGAVFSIRNGDLSGTTQKEILFWQTSTLAAAGVTTVVVVGGAALLGTDWLIGGNHAE